MMDGGDNRTTAENDVYRLLVDSIADYAIFMLDPSGRVASWNPGAQRFKGYEPSEIIGQHFSRFYTEEDRASGLPAEALQASSTRQASAPPGGRSAAMGACRVRDPVPRRGRTELRRQRTIPLVHDRGSI